MSERPRLLTNTELAERESAWSTPSPSDRNLDVWADLAEQQEEELLTRLRECERLLKEYRTGSHADFCADRSENARCPACVDTDAYFAEVEQ